ncbi:hypothetical protein [Paraburkholderia sp.]|uniref:hypothetical protein n=1 Tax=Paraburkholderia sp. TaxID=1926495 RepID=UPI0025F86B06|nr:hypothetical protein [Paraburkholderia sp.]
MMLTLTVPTLLFFVALFATISAMHRGVSRKADAKLRAEFEAEGPGSEVSRQLMRHSGYGV